jgi:hypothetical protein
MRRFISFVLSIFFIPFGLFSVYLSFETVGEYEGNAIYTEVKVIGRYGFLVAGKEGVHIFDVSNPNIPIKISEIGSMGCSYSLDVVGFRLFLADGVGGVRIFDIRDKKNPEQVSFIPTNHASIDLEVSGDYCYVAEGEGGLRIIDISKPLFPTEISNWNESGYVKSVEVVDNYAYLADKKGVLVLDISDPDSLREPVRIKAIDSVNKIISDGCFLFVSSDEKSLLVSDVTDITHPLLQEMPGIYIGIEDLFVSGFYLYAVQKNLVWVFNTLVPLNPKFAGRAIFPREVSGIYVRGNLLYAACGFDGFAILQIKE